MLIAFIAISLFGSEFGSLFCSNADNMAKDDSGETAHDRCIDEYLVEFYITWLLVLCIVTPIQLFVVSAFVSQRDSSHAFYHWLHTMGSPDQKVVANPEATSHELKEVKGAAD